VGSYLSGWQREDWGKQGSKPGQLYVFPKKQHQFRNVNQVLN
jgi:hypothetical protein